MEPMARGVTGLLLAGAALAFGATAAMAGEPAPSPSSARPKPSITGGHDVSSSWLVGEYRELQIRKRTDRATLAAAIDVRMGGDVVRITVAPRAVSVARGNRVVAIDSPEAYESVQQLLGGSAAVFAVRAMLSELEPVSELTAPDMALLSSAAFIASLVGDVGAPQRIADRFVAKHRGLFRQVRDSGGCWSSYASESTSAWNDLQSCMDDADAKGIFRAAYERVACNAVWLLRAESAWFEYLKCLSPLAAFQ